MPENNRKMQTDISEFAADNENKSEENINAVGLDTEYAENINGKGEVRSAFRWTDIFGDTDRKRMSVGSKTDLNFWISWNTVRGRDCAGSNFRSGSTWRSGELFSKGKDRKMPGAGGRYAAGTCGRTSKSVEVRNGKSRPTGDYAVS